jgi:hypothetical protein
LNLPEFQFDLVPAVACLLRFSLSAVTAKLETCRGERRNGTLRTSALHDPVMFGVLLISAVVGVFVAEVVLLVVRAQWIRTQLTDIRSRMLLFWRSIDDDARQQAILRCGWAMIRGGTSALALTLALTGVVTAVPWLLGWTAMNCWIYGAAASLIGALWWFVWRAEDSAAPFVGSPEGPR